MGQISTFDACETIPTNPALRLCSFTGKPCLAAEEICTRLTSATRFARAVVGAEFELNGQAQVSHCGRNCHFIWRATANSTCCIGNVSPDTDVNLLFETGFAGLVGPVVFETTHQGLSS